MIGAIGTMFAAYIIVQMSQILGRPKGTVDLVTQILAGITVIVTIICVLVMLAMGMPAPR
jgi:hypothetical protein